MDNLKSIRKQKGITHNIVKINEIWLAGAFIIFESCSAMLSLNSKTFIFK